MEIIKDIKQKNVWNHWKTTEGFSDNDFRSDVRDPLPPDVKWYLALLETADIDHLYIISSDDWKTEKLCEPDFKLITAISNYQSSPYNGGKSRDIREKEMLLKNDIKALDTKLILVASNIRGPFTIIEGNKRAVALGNLDNLNNIEVFLGISKNVREYEWARYTISD